MQGLHDDALAALQKGLAIGKKLVEADPGNSQCKWTTPASFISSVRNSMPRGKTTMRSMRCIGESPSCRRSSKRPDRRRARRELAMQYAVVGFISSSRKKDFQTAIENLDQTIRLVPNSHPPVIQMLDHAMLGPIGAMLCRIAPRRCVSIRRRIRSTAAACLLKLAIHSAIADYSRAQAQSKAGRLAYGRGTAEAKGDNTTALADIAAAKRSSPTLRRNSRPTASAPAGTGENKIDVRRCGRYLRAISAASSPDSSASAVSKSLASRKLR